MKFYQFAGYFSESIPIGKIICLARTYKKHADEMNASLPSSPVLFIKPNSAVIFSGQSIVIPPQSKCVHHEVELGIIIGKNGKRISEKRADDHILGYNVCLDITARDIQSEAKKNGLPWGIAKGFDTFAPISDVITKDCITDPQNLEIKLLVNNEVRQVASIKQMIWSPSEIISYISEIMTLEKGDLIMTGTPEGVDILNKGDMVQAKLGSFCTLEVDVQ
jgi:2-keto-4-pentenoate hydratase/2-oxohepta-3-ene-1,7-dioic acid hydratase in catechol pathway